MPLCKRCLKAYNEAESEVCRFHPGLFVCRFHPNSAKASGDGLGYYGDPKWEGWEAKFWDCCGSEDEGSPGCVAGRHRSFDDDLNFPEEGLYVTLPPPKKKEMTSRP